MLILTDRLNDGQDLRRLLKPIGPCELTGLHQAARPATAVSLIVCDVAFDDLTSIRLAQAFMATNRGDAVPVLCLVRDPSHLTEAYARSIGATAILSRHTPPHELIAVARSLISKAADSGPTRQAETIEAEVRSADHALISMFEAARQRKPISARALQRGGNAVLAAIRRAPVRAWLDIVWQYDDATYQHCLLVAGLAAAFAFRVGLAHRHQLLMAQAALVHDIGKARVPLSILNKPGKLTAPEMTVMKTHAALGHGMLVRQTGFNPQLLDIVRHHHEYVDGSGYLDGLRGEQISQFVRMTTICDIYAALIERRPYKAPMPSHQALSILADTDGKLDAALVQAFAATLARS